MKLSSTEDKLIGQWIFKNGKVEKDVISERIEWLINSQLNKIGTDKSGWDTLYLDPKDNRFWELTYPESEMQGGGPPALVCMSTKEAWTKYSGSVVHPIFSNDNRDV